MGKIDLHLHTQRCKKGDGKRRAIDTETFISIMQSQNIDVCAITNHNRFDIDEYRSITENKSVDFLLLPGIELDVLLENNKTRHIILVCSPDVVRDFEKVFSDPERDCDNYRIEYRDFVSSVKNFDVDKIIIIPHFRDKDKDRSINEKEKDNLKKDLEKYTFILEPKMKSMGIINAHNELSLIGSDVKDWSEYAKDAKDLPEIKFPIESFGKFYELASSPSVFIKSVLNCCEKERIPIDDVGNHIYVFKDINVIFGGKGSGKTVLMESYILPRLSEMGMNVLVHKGKEYQAAYESMISSFEETVTIDSRIHENIVDDIDFIFNYREAPIGNFVERYLKYKQEQKATKNAQKVRKTESVYCNNEIGVIKDECNRYGRMRKDIEEVEIINAEIRDSTNEDREVLSDELQKLKRDVYNDVLLRSRTLFSAAKTDAVLDNIKKTIEKKTGKKSKPNSIGFSKMVSNRRVFLERITNVANRFDQIRMSKKTKIGELPDKGEIFVVVNIDVLDKDKNWSQDSPFKRNGYSANRAIMKKIVNFEYKQFSSINTLFESHEREITGEVFFSDCVKKSSVIIKENGENYAPSDGEMSILSISGFLENVSYDCYLFDEIERGLGNEYISSYIIPKLKYLRDIGKMVVISTHNANIAVSTLPSQTIYCNYLGDSNAEIYYEGNMYSNELVSIKNPDNIIDWEEEAIKHLEGSEHMFSVRRNIWNLKK